MTLRSATRGWWCDRCPCVWCSLLVVVRVAWHEIGGMRVRAFPVRLPSGVRYWTVLDEDLAVVGEADAFLRHVRFGRDGSELTTRAYAGGIALFLRWCARTGRHWQAGVEQFGLFITWLRQRRAAVSGADAGGRAGEVLTGPGRAPVRGARRVNAVLTAVRGFVAHAVATGAAPAGLVPLLYEVADDRDLPRRRAVRTARMAWRLRARHRLREPERRWTGPAMRRSSRCCGGCRSARDRLIVLLMARAGLRRGEVCGLRRSDVHLLPDSRRWAARPGGRTCTWSAATTRTGRGPSRGGSGRCRWTSWWCRRSTRMSSSGWPCRRRRQRLRAGQPVPRAGRRADAAGRGQRADRRGRTAGRAGARRSRRISCGTRSGATWLTRAARSTRSQDLLGHASMSSSQVYLHPDPARLREAVERVPSPRELTGARR